MIRQILRRFSGQYQIPAEEEALVDLYWKRYEIALFEERFDSALVFLERILELRPRSIETRIARARLFELSGDTRRALDAWLRLLPLAQCEHPLAAEEIRKAIDALIGTGETAQNVTGSSEGTTSTVETSPASLDSISSAEMVTLPTESQYPFPAGQMPTESPRSPSTVDPARFDDSSAARKTA